LGTRHVEDRKGNGAGIGLSRKRFLVLGGVGLAGAALLGIVGAGRTRMATSAPDLGISPSNTGQQNRENLLRVLSNTRQSITFPPGDYYVDATYPDIVIRNYGGEWAMEPGARLVLQDRNKDVQPTGEAPEPKGGRGLVFAGNHPDGTGAKFYGLRTTYEAPLPSVRIQSQECVLFVDTKDTVVRDAEINGSHAAGLLFERCERPKVERVLIRNTMADGLHFANCQDAKADAVTTENTGDDGVAFLNYDGSPDVRPDFSGGTATNVIVRNAGSRGITVIGQRDITVENFEVDGSYSSGVLVAYETSYRTRIPSGVRYANGIISNAGKAAPGAVDSPGNKFGVEYNSVRSVEFSNVKVYGAAGRGVGGTARAFTRTNADGTTVQEPAGTVVLNGVEVRGALEEGFNLQGGTCRLDNLVASGTGKTGVWIEAADLVQYGKLTAENTSKEDPLRRAFNFESNARVENLVGTTRPQELHVVDDQPIPLGYKVSTNGQQAGGLGTVYDRVVNGDLDMTENRSNLGHTLRT
jgi:hypothetical protein